MFFFRGSSVCLFGCVQHTPGRYTGPEKLTSLWFGNPESYLYFGVPDVCSSGLLELPFDVRENLGGWF